MLDVPQGGGGGRIPPGLNLGWGLGKSSDPCRAGPSPTQYLKLLPRQLSPCALTQGRLAPSPVPPSLLGSPEKEAFKKRAKLQQENSEETDDNEAEEVRDLPPQAAPLSLPK